MTDAFRDIEKFETDLWEAADNLRANSKLTSSDYFMPVLGVIFLRHAANRFEAATMQIQADQAAGKMPKRPPVNADYVSQAVALAAGAGALRCDHGKGRNQRQRPAQARYRSDDGY